MAAPSVDLRDVTGRGAFHDRFPFLHGATAVHLPKVGLAGP